MATRGESMSSMRSGYGEVQYWGGDRGYGLLWFLVITIIIFLIIGAFKPSWVLQNGSNTQIDGGKLLFSSILIALAVFLLLWIIAKALSK